jgi:hypothetical protein
MNSTEEQRWHWEQGVKFAIEGIKALILINGVAAISILTFLGHHGTLKLFLAKIKLGMIFFSFGVLSATICFILSYVVQLKYGNNFISKIPRVIHTLVYIFVFLSIVFFVCGIILIYLGILNAPK